MPGRLTFKTTPDGGTAATERMRITSAGDVGIGTTPTAKLDIVGPAGGTSLRLTDNTNSTLNIKHESPGNLVTYESGGVASQRWLTNSVERMRVTAAGNVGIGTTAPANKFEVNGDNVASAARGATSAGQSIIEAQANDYWSGPTYTGTSLRQYGSTATGTTAGLSNANLGYLNFQNGSAGLIGTNGASPIVFMTTYTERMRIEASGAVTVNGTLSAATAAIDTDTTQVATTAYVVGQGYLKSATASSTYLTSATAASTYAPLASPGLTGTPTAPTAGGGTNTTQIATTAFVQTAVAGKTLIETGSGGVGYGTGSGGTITQITNKSTGVTINKTNGQIITASGNVVAGTPTSFLVTNSTVAATDVVIVHRSSGGSNVSYTIGCDLVSAGSFRVYIDNITGAGLNEVLTLNFAVIKAVAA
jgi:hypothetical protein